MGKSSVNRGKITSTNSTHPTSKTAKQIPLQRIARHTEPISRSDLVLEPELVKKGQTRIDGMDEKIIHCPAGDCDAICREGALRGGADGPTSVRISRTSAG